MQEGIRRKDLRLLIRSVLLILAERETQDGMIFMISNHYSKIVEGIFK